MARLVDLALLLAGCCCLLRTVMDHSEIEWSTAIDTTIKPFVPATQHNEQMIKSTVIPRPLLADLNGDGANELVLVNGVSNVLIYAHRSAMTSRQFADYQSSAPNLLSLPHLNVGSNDFALVFTFDTSSQSTAPFFPSLQRIIAVQAGFIDVYHQAINRKQVLLIMNAALQIWCVDTTSRQVIWTRTLTFNDNDDESSEQSNNDDAIADVLEAQILINPSPMRINDTGVVIVGVRLADGVDGAAGHFSFVALSGQSGDVRWMHSSEHRHGDRVRSDASKVYHASNAVHSGEIEWRNFRDAFHDALPHQWYASSDTRFKLAHLERRNQNADQSDKASVKQPMKPLFSTTNRSPFHVSLNARLSHDDNEHVEHPNAIVTYTSEGIELIHFYTGRALSHLQLDPYVSHVDVNGDLVIDHVAVLEPETAEHSHEGAAAHSKQAPKDHKKRCDLTATSGIPPQLNLYNTSVCSTSPFLSGVAFSWLTGSNEVNSLALKSNRTFGNARMRALNKQHDPSLVDVEAVQTESARHVESVVVASGPLLLPARVDNDGGTRRFTAYALASNGWFTGTDWRGRRVLNMKTQASFDSSDVNSIVGLRVRHYPLHVDSASVSPDHDYVLLIGSRSLVIVDRMDSSIVDTFDLPIPGSRVQLIRIGELNGDQYNDLIVETNTGVTAFIVHVYASSTFFVRSLMLLCAAIVAAILLQVHLTAQPKLEQAIKQSIKFLGFETPSAVPTMMPTISRHNSTNHSNQHSNNAIIQRHSYRDVARPPV